MWRQTAKISRSSSFPGAKYFSLQKPHKRCNFKINGLHRSLSTGVTEGRGGMGVFVVTAGITGLIGGTFYYAKKRPDFRQTIENKLPFTHNIFDSTLGKTEIDLSKKQSTLLPPSLPASSHTNENVASDHDQLFEHLENDISGKKLKSSKDEPSVTVSSVDQIAVSSVDLDISKTVEKEVLESEEDKNEESDELTAIETRAKEVSLQTAVAAVIDVGEHVLQSAKDAIDAVCAHKYSIEQALNNKEAELSNEQCEHIESLAQNKLEALYNVEAMMEKYDELVEKVHLILVEAKGMETMVASETLSQLTNNVKQARECLKKEEREATVIKQYEDYLKQKQQVIQENANDQIRDKSDGELLVRALKNKIQLLEDSVEARNKEQEKMVTEALQKQKDDDEKRSEMKLKHELENLKTELTNIMKEKEATIMEEHEIDLRQQLRRQAAVFGDHLNDVLKIQESELNEKHQREKHQELLLQRQEFDLKICGILGRLQGVLKAVENRASVEKANFEAQELWLACQSLFQAITDSAASQHHLHYTSRLSTIKEEVERIRHVTNYDQVICGVLDSLPQDVLQRGLFTENLLLRRFSNVKKVCQQVALVTVEDTSVWSYLVSYFQSLLMFDLHHVKHPISVDPRKLDTHTILSLATKSLDDGDTEQAVRYMNQLRGEAKRVAQDWIDEARLFLETKQVSKFLMALSSAYNIGTK